MAMDFKLSDDFVNSYADKEVPWGYKDGAGNALGEITALRTYSRIKEDGTKEKWHEICRRVIEGMFTIQKRHIRKNHLEWKNDKAQRTAKDAYDRMFNMKWLPPGRGIWSMGSPLVMEENDSSSLQNCAFASTEQSFIDAAEFLFDASMVGVGVGFDSLGARKFTIVQPEEEEQFVIPDSREGWVESYRRLLSSYIDEGQKRSPKPVFDYSLIRPKGEPIKRFGGVASGPEPLKKLHDKTREILDNHIGEKVSMRIINDIMNLIGTCVIAGNVRRCLPEGSKVHTPRGLVNIEDLQVGDEVETTGRIAKVTNVFDQGVQETVIVKYDGGEIECTPNHQIAVFDTPYTWTFKRADELTTEDRVVWDRTDSVGGFTKLPESSEHVEKDLDSEEPAIPLQVLEVVPSGRSVQTWDIEVEDIHQFTAEGIVVHNSAEISFIDSDSPDVDEFIDLKDYEKNPDRVDHGFMANNSVIVKVGDDYSKYMDGVKLNGEPGFIWADVARKYGRLKDAPDYKDTRIMGTNPCFPADTRLATESGWITFGEAYRSGEEQNILVDGRVSFEESVKGEEYPEDWKIDLNEKYAPKIMQASEVFLTQKNASIVKVTLSNGIELRCTPDHLIATKVGMVRADDLTSEHKVLITRGFVPEDGLPDLSLRENIDGFLMGLIAGDGYIDQGKLTEKVYVDLWGDDRELAPIVEGWITDLFNQYRDKYVSQSNRPFTSHNVETREDRNQIRISSSFLAAYLNGEYGFNKSSKTVVPSKLIANANSSAARAYVAGLAFADGTVNKNNKVGSSNIRIGQTRKSLLQDVQAILLSNGIASSVYSRQTAGLSEVHGKPFHSSEFFELVIMGNAYEFTKHVGFGFGPKAALAESLFTSPSRKQATYSTVISVEDDGVEDVYCLRENTRRILSANGVTARRCGEQFLENFECCTLCEVFIGNCEDQDDFIKTLKVAYMYGKTVTLLPTKWEKTNAVMQRNRRIGLSVSGSADYVDKHGLPALRATLDDGSDYIEILDKKYSEWLGVRESIRRRTVKPAGTIAILAGSSPGVHWTPGGKYFIRRITFSKDDKLFKALKDAGYESADLDYDPNSAVILFPVKSQSERSSSDVPIWEKFNLAAELQHWWSDNAVSCTVDFGDDEADSIPKLLSAYEGRFKGISFLPRIEQGAYKNMPYEQITEEKFHEMSKNLKKVSFDSAYYGDVQEAVGEVFCTTDVCETTTETDALNDAIKVFPGLDLDDVEEEVNV